MTLTVARPLPTTDELVVLALERLEKALAGLDKPMTSTRKHLIRNDLTVAKIALLTPPLRPEEVG